jgi:hypothetical protein
MIDRKLLIGFGLGILFLIIGAILKILEQDYSLVFLGIGLVISSVVFMRFAWSNIKKK